MSNNIVVLHLLYILLVINNLIHMCCLSCWFGGGKRPLTTLIQYVSHYFEEYSNANTVFEFFLYRIRVWL